MKQAKQLVITFDIHTTKNYMEKASETLEAEINAECMPCGDYIKTGIAPPFRNIVYIQRGGKWIELGEAEVDVIYPQNNL